MSNRAGALSKVEMARLEREFIADEQGNRIPVDPEIDDLLFKFVESREDSGGPFARWRMQPQVVGEADYFETHTLTWVRIELRESQIGDLHSGDWEEHTSKMMECPYPEVARIGYLLQRELVTREARARELRETSVRQPPSEVLNQRREQVRDHNNSIDWRAVLGTRWVRYGKHPTKETFEEAAKRAPPGPVPVWESRSERYTRERDDILRRRDALNDLAVEGGILRPAVAIPMRQGWRVRPPEQYPTLVQETEQDGSDDSSSQHPLPEGSLECYGHYDDEGLWREGPRSPGMEAQVAAQVVRVSTPLVSYDEVIPLNDKRIRRERFLLDSDQERLDGFNFQQDPILPRGVPVSEDEMPPLQGVYTEIIVILRMDWSNATLRRRWGK